MLRRRRKPPSRSMRGVPPPHPSRRAHARSSLRNPTRTRAPQDEAAQTYRARGSSPNRSRSSPSHDVKQPRSARSRGAFLRPGFATLLRSPESRGGRSAESRSGAALSARWARHIAARQALARRLASHDAGRSPLGAPPWRFWAPGAALPSPSAPAVLQRRAGAIRIRAASSSHPGRSAWRAGSLPPEANGYEPPPQDATPHSAFRIVSRTRPQ
jgi:hypothetical protein